MNTTIETLTTRRSVKRYTSAMPPREVLAAIASAGTFAPSGMGQQSARIVVVTDRGVRDLLSRLNAAVLGTDADPFYGAPAVMVVLADRSRPTCVYDGTLVMGNLMNAAHAAGLGSCWIHRAREVFDSPEGRRLLREWGIEGDYEGIGHCIVGYPAEGSERPEKPRKPGYVVWVE